MYPWVHALYIQFGHIVYACCICIHSFNLDPDMQIITSLSLHLTCSLIFLLQKSACHVDKMWSTETWHFFFFLFLNNRHQNIEGFGIWTHCTFLFQYSFKPKCYCYYLKVCCEYLAVTSFPFLFYCRHSESWTQRMKFFTDKTPIRLWLVLIHTIVLI